MSAAESPVKPSEIASPTLSSTDSAVARVPRAFRVIRIAAWFALAAYLALMLTLTHVPRAPGILADQPDKRLHFIGYFALGSLAYATVTLNFPRRTGLSLIIVLSGVAFAALDEATQPMFHRTSDVMDWRADAFGLIVGVILVGIPRFFIRLKARKRGA